MIRRIELELGTFVFSDEAPCASAAKNAPRDPVVLLHGFTGSKDSWLELREKLKGTHRVVSIDLPGHGGTAVGDAIENYSMERSAAMLAAALAKILDDARFSLVGYSMGGRLALYVALAYGARVSRLVLESACAGIADLSERARRRQSDEELAAFIERAGIEAFVSRWERLPLFESLAKLPADGRERLRRQRLECSAAGLARSLRAMGTGAQPWLGERLGELAMPVLVVAGALDRKFVEIGRDLASRIPRARLEIIEGSGHVPHLERPEEFNRLVTNFLGPRCEASSLK